jgi:CRISPR-associated protein Cmr4
MYKIAKPFFMVVETPLHAGSGQELGIVDMPIQRERHTDFPKIEGSGLKGSIREVFETLKTEGNKVNSDKLKKEFSNADKFVLEEKWEIDNDGKKEIKMKDGEELIKFDEAISLSFGPEEGDAHAGALGFTDARILLFPVKSMKGVFAYITCPMVLDKFKKDLELCKNSESIKNYFFKNKSIPTENTITNLGELGINGKIILEEYAFDVKAEQTTVDFAERLSKILGIDAIKNKLVILSNDDFRDFVNLSTEVITRTKINPETGTVQTGALFTEEYLPTETVLYSLVLSTPIFNKEKGIFAKTDAQKEEERVMDFFEKGVPEIIQIGGNATIGKGIVEIKTWEETSND